MAFKTKWWERWLARAFHVLLTTGVVTVLFVKDTELRRSMENERHLFAACFLALLSAAMLSYFLASFVDPGYVHVKPSTVDVEGGVDFQDTSFGGLGADSVALDEKGYESEASKMMLPEGSALKLRRCGYCEIRQPLRSKHCEECGFCIRKYDHHCPWLATCIGERNHRFFWAFLGLESALIMWSIKIVWSSFKSESNGKDWLKFNWILLCLMIFLVLVCIVVSLLFCCHSYMMFTAQTTWEFMSRSRISYLKYFPNDENPFDQGFIKNSVVFLCYCKPRTWENLIKDKIFWK